MIPIRSFSAILMVALSHFAGTLGAQSLALQNVWNDPGFQARFGGSYAPLTEREPRPAEPEQTFFRETVLPLLPNNIDQAMAVIRTRLDQASAATEPALAFTLANLYFERSDLANAQRYYQLAISQFDSFMRAHRNLAFVAVLRGDEDLAHQHAVRAYSLGDTDAYLHGLLGELFLKRDRLLSAESALLGALITDPDNLTWKWLLVQTYIAQERWNEAKNLLDTIVAANPNDSALWAAYIRIHLGAGDTENAAIAAETLRQMGVSTNEHLVLLGRAFQERGITELAYNAYVAALETTPLPDLQEMISVAEWLLDREAYAEAQNVSARIRRAYARQTISNRDANRIRAVEAFIAVEEGKGAEVANALAQILNENPMNGRALIALATHYGKIGETQMADLLFDRAKDVKAMETIAYYRHGLLKIQQDNWDEAAQFMRSALEITESEQFPRFVDQIGNMPRAEGISGQ